MHSMKRITEVESQFYRELKPETDFIYNMKQAAAFTVVANEDGWDHVTYYGEAWVDPSLAIKKPHFVYILVNPSMPGVCKIGYTSKTVYERCRQINSSAGVIIPWYPVFAYKCPSGPLLEKEVHNYLEKMGKRVSNNKEGFEVDSTEAIKIVEELGKRYQNI